MEKYCGKIVEPDCRTSHVYGEEVLWTCFTEGQPSKLSLAALNTRVMSTSRQPAAHLASFARFCLHCSGFLLRHNRCCIQVTPKPATSLDANILSVAPTAPRFSYLPISTPSLHNQPMRHTTAKSALPAANGAGIGLVPTGPAGLARPSDMLEQTGDYSFANINVGRAVSAVTAEQQRAVESASGTTLEASNCCIWSCLTPATCTKVSCT